MKKQYFTLSVIVGLIAMVWIFVSNGLGWLGWPAFIGWSIYFYGGAKPQAIIESGPGFLLGILLAFIAVWAQGILAGNALLVVIPVFILSFLMTYAQNIKWFQVAPATFLGSALYFGTGSLFDCLVIGFLVGMVTLGLLTTVLSRSFVKE